MTVTSTANGVTMVVPVGDYVQYGLDATVTNNGGFGIASYQTGITNSNNGIAVVNPAVTTINPFFSSVAAAGSADTTGGVNPALGTAGSYIAGNTLSTAKIAYGVTSPAELYSTQRVRPVAAGTVTLTVSDNAVPLGVITNGVPTPSGAATYANRAYDPLVDTVSVLPSLTIVYGSATSTGTGTGTGTTTTTAANKIISLTSTAPTAYGSQLGTAIHITGGNGSYTTGNTGLVAGQTTAFTATSTFSPITDTEVYALKLSSNGSAIATTNTTLIAAIIADINGSNNASTGSVVASTVSGVYASLFPGYDVLLTSTGFSASAAGVAYLGVDFSGDTDAATPALTVTEIAAVPEPMSATMLVLGASGLLLKRRKSRELVA